MASTTTEATTQSHLTPDEVAALGRVKPSPKARIGVIASYVGMGLIVLYCIIPFYWMLVSAFRDPSEGRSTEFIPSPASIENFKGVFGPSNNFGRSLINSVIVASTTTILTLLFGIVGRVRACPAVVQG
jgi:multiple sugar transport system permease protein